MKTRIEIQNLKCGGCETTILNKLLGVEGVETVSINVPTNRVIIEYTEESVLLKIKKHFLVSAIQQLMMKII
ncbi:heavy-metal-associated domain-containing protein [Aquimarina agarivorans]|uniref:heavy-metal-associated domain-containing protein n=1 Tax=Aquimarina agarivorans TaxID=980584 RepID=UPI000248EBB1|nr:heavy metal-associated domain-containing protein [Aquimarina agarivorans]